MLTFVFAFGIPLVLAFLQNFISSYNERLGYRIMGRKLYYIFVARIGVPVHELGHALFAVIFRHKITEMKLFEPDSKKGTLGYVNHSYNKKSLYQKVGNFFIGIGPVILGSLVLYTLAAILFDISVNADESQTSSPESQASVVLSGGWQIITAIFSSGSFLKSFLFLYLVFAIGSNITLSKADLQGAYKGFGFLMLALFLFHFSTVWLLDSSKDIALIAGGITSGLSTILGVAIILNLMFSLILKLLSGVMRR